MIAALLLRQFCGRIILFALIFDILVSFDLSSRKMVGNLVHIHVNQYCKSRYIYSTHFRGLDHIFKLLHYIV